jgi:non-canonical purine NTP pyrophosphatase (RdgB/HAM1 family)
MNVIFVTGNQHKADILTKFLGYPVEHRKLELDEIQSLDSKKIVEHKVKQAHKLLKVPVLVEDISLNFDVFGKLPGPFIKWFEEEIGLEGMCRMLDPYNRTATASVTFGYFDGRQLEFFKGNVKGSITKDVRPGDNSFGWNSIFVPYGHTKAYVEMNDDEQAKYGLRPSTVFPQIKEFLSAIDNK